MKMKILVVSSSVVPILHLPRVAVVTAERWVVHLLVS
jgi:hypothetical protein